ncbi:DUF2493 domain-containing protein [Rhodospira trueperi]|uniref:YspA cpYpsA-related SLOG domain-containing protein n=1 Tax=Rhodospira trueperi TaxID=69960 RepID=A0A1G7IDY9_9PROT|nr:DUF2493 domain-containing protein [Rhodospira trueperi]SDF10539.1 Protein of unknown function [Rhodospira trueperi]
MIRDVLPPTDDPHATASATAHLLEELHLYGIRPFQDEPDPRPMPDAETAGSAVTACLDTLADLLTGTRLEDDLGDLLWSVVNAFHRRVGALDRALDTNEQAQRRSQAEQDGSEVRSVELERLTAEGIGLIERRNAFEAFRDTAAESFEAITGGAWRPRAGSLTNRRALTAAVIDSRDFLAARQRAETQVMLPPGPRVAFAGGPACTDHRRIWAVLDKVRDRHPDMVLLHGGAPKGAERIAACWADQRGVPQVVFRPDWTRHGKAAPFRRNEQLLESLPIGVIVFPGSGITDNLADTARRMGIPVWKVGSEGGA